MKQLDQTSFEWTTVARMTGLTWARLLQLEAVGKFPARMAEASEQCWRREDVENWIRERAAL